MINAKIIRRLAILAFALYALALFTATHWPDLKIDRGPVKRPDLYIHVVAFAGWTTLLIASQILGRWHTTSSVLKCASVGLLYALFDEGTQAIPALGRTFGLDDLAANFAGVLLAAGAALVASKLMRAARSPSAGGAAAGKAD